MQLAMAEVPAVAIPTPRTMLRIHEPLANKLIGLFHIFSSLGSCMWVHPDLIDDDQWNSTRSTNGNNKKELSNMISFIAKCDPNFFSPMYSSEDDQIIYQNAITFGQTMGTGLSSPISASMLKSRCLLPYELCGSTIHTSLNRVPNYYIHKGKQKGVCFDKPLKNSMPLLKDCSGENGEN